MDGSARKVASLIIHFSGTNNSGAVLIFCCFFNQFLFSPLVGLCGLMKQAIIGYHKDQENDWVAELCCAYFQHVRYNSPFINRPWVTTERGWCSMLGYELNCNKCDSGAEKDVFPDL
jgi:hypothetical protein